MSDALAILTTLLELMVALIVLGEPLRLLLSRISTFFRNLDFVEVCALDVYLGGLILYILALAPLHLFDTSVILGLMLISVMISTIHYLRLWKRRRGPNEHGQQVQRKGKVLKYGFVLGMFLLFLYIQILPFTSLVYGSIHDTSYHSILVEVIIENKCIPSTLEPYLPEGIIYPQAAHVIFAFATNLTGWLVPQAVAYVTQFFNALTILGAYFLGKKIWHDSTFHLAMVFVFTFVAAWPMFVTWGANPFVVGFAMFLISLGVLFAMFFDSGKKDKRELLAIGLLFGYLGAIIISFLQTLLMIAVVWLLMQFFLRYSNLKDMSRNIGFLFAISFLPLSPFLFRFASYYPNLGHNIGLPADFVGYPRSQYWVGQGLHWMFENLFPCPFLRTEMVVVCILSAALFFAVGKRKGSRQAFSAALLILTASISLSLLSDVLPADLNIVSSGHQGIIITVGLYLLVALFGYHLFAVLHRILSKFPEMVLKKSSSLLLASILVLSAIYSPFVRTRLLVDPSTLRDAYGMFAVASNDDNDLMLWIRENLTNKAVILVNQYESGLFIPAVSHRKAIFATPGSQLSRNYQKLIGLICNGKLNATCYSIMRSFGITHVYVGSVATYWWIKDYTWKPQVFLDDSHFLLVKNMGKAYLFQVLYEDQ